MCVVIKRQQEGYFAGISQVAQTRLTLCNPVDCTLSGSSIHGISQARVLEWVSIAFSITLLTKVHIIKVMIFQVVMYGCESWTIEKTEHLLNCGVGEDSCESLGLQGDPTSQS